MDAATATVVDVQLPTGPNWWTNAKNWSQIRVPLSTDTVVFENGSVPCAYGITNVAAIAGLDVYRSYTGRIGLAEARDDGSTEQLPQYLSLSNLGTKIAIRIGLGDEGDGPGIVRINTQSQECDVVVLHSSQSSAETLYTVGLAGDLASVQVNSASVIFSAGTVRYAVAPMILQADSAVIRDPLITISDLRWHSDPGFLDENFGSQGVFKREQSVAVSYYSTSYANSGGGVVGG